MKKHIVYFLRKNLHLSLLFLLIIPTATSQAISVDVMLEKQRSQKACQSIAMKKGQYQALEKAAIAYKLNSAGDIGRIDASKAIDRTQVLSAANNDRGCSAKIRYEVSPSKLEILFRQTPSKLNDNVATIIRYVENGQPVRGASSLNPTRKLQKILDGTGANVIDLTEYATDFQSLIFPQEFCPVTGAIPEECSDFVNYSEGALRIFRSIVDRSHNAETYGKNLIPFTQCGGIVLIGEMRIEDDSSVRNSLKGQFEWIAFDFITRRRITSDFSEVAGAFRRGVGSKEAEVDNMIITAMSLITSQLAQSREGQLSDCRRG